MGIYAEDLVFTGAVQSVTKAHGGIEKKNSRAKLWYITPCFWIKYEYSCL